MNRSRARQVPFRLRVMGVLGWGVYPRPPHQQARPRQEIRQSVEREMVQDALRRHRGKIMSAAVELGISRPTLYELMEKLGIAREG